MPKKVLTILVLCVILIAGCDNLPWNKPQQPKPEKSPVLSYKGPLLAQVGNWAIGKIDFENQLKAVRAINAEIDTENKEFQKRFLQELVDIETLAQEAEAQGVDKEKEVQDAIRNFKRTLLAQKMLGDIAKSITVTDVEIKNFYESNKLALTEPQQTKVREIVVSTETEAKDLLIKLLKGEDFASLAKEYSVSENKSKGGDLGYLIFGSENIPERLKNFEKFWQTVFTTEKGSSSNYFKGEEGYYIIKVEDIKEGKITPLSEVREAIEERLRRDKIEKKKDDIVFSAKSKFEIKVNSHLLD
ncbi:MAG: peptidyl-prolyl cis-trans isomerase [Candidatus Omnitrophota bacterium]